MTLFSSRPTKPLRAFVFIGCLLVSLAACALPNQDTFPTPIPEEFLGTAIALTVQAGQPANTPTPVRPAGTRTPTPVILPTASPTPIPSITPTPRNRPTQASPASPTPTELPLVPLAEIEITYPGPMSKVASPIPLRALMQPGADDRVTIELLGEDGRLLARQLFFLNFNPNRKSGLVSDVPFEINAVAEVGRLQVYKEDEFGRPIALASVDLILLSEGASDINVPGDGLERIYIRQPVAGTLIQGGRVVLEGDARPVTNQPLVVELVNERGGVVGSRVLPVAAGPANQHRPFFIEVPYEVNEPTWVRLTIRERGERIPGTAYLSSVNILLGP